MIKTIYIIFLGILIATFIGVGVAAFYPIPKPPQYFPLFSQPTKIQDASSSANAIRQENEFQKKQQDFTTASQIYNRNVSIITLISAVIILIGSLIFAKHLTLLADGLLLGSLFTLIYSISRGFAANDDIYRFIVVSISLGIVVYIGFIKFLRPQK